MKETRLTVVAGEDEAEFMLIGELLRDLDALTNAMRSRRCTSVSVKLNCLPFESKRELLMLVMTGEPK